MRNILLTLLFSLSTLSAHENPWTSADFLKESFEAALKSPKILPIRITIQDPKQENAEKLSDQDFFEQASGVWVEKLGEYKSTQKQAKFLKDNQVKFFLKDSGLLMPPNMALTWNPEGIYVNKSVLSSVIKKGRENGASDEEIMGTLVYVLLPMVAHESSHGVRLTELEKLLGAKMLLPLEEEEELAMSEMIPLIKEMAAQNPMILKTYGPMLNSWKSSPTAMKDMVKRLYPNIVSVSGDLEITLKRIAFSSKTYEGMFDKKRKLEKQLSETTDEKEKKRIQKELAGAPSDEDFKVCMERIIVAEMILKNKEKTAQWKEFYASKMKELGELWKKENGPKENK